MHFTAKQREVLRSVADRKWREVHGEIRVRGIRNNGKVDEVCPVCAAGIKVRPIHHAVAAYWANEDVQLGLSDREVTGIITASDCPQSPYRQELMQLLGMTP